MLPLAGLLSLFEHCIRDALIYLFFLHIIARIRTTAQHTGAKKYTELLTDPHFINHELSFIVVRYAPVNPCVISASHYRGVASLPCKFRRLHLLIQLCASAELEMLSHAFKEPWDCVSGLSSDVVFSSSAPL